MEKATLISILKRILDSDEDLNFLHKLDESDLIMLVKLVRERMGSSRPH